LSITIEDPAKITGHDYKIWFSSVNDTLKWNLTDKSANKNVFFNQNFKEFRFSNYWSYTPEDKLYVYEDGLKIFINSYPEPITNIEVIANQSGILIPSEGGALPDVWFPSKMPTDKQQVGNGIWILHTRSLSNNSYEAFLSSTLRSSNYTRFVNHDWEMRFTEQGSYALKFLQDRTIVHVPFELWCIGINTPDDPSDDYKLIPFIYDRGEDNGFNLERWGALDHSVSEGDNDPYTDWIYWNKPQDVTPGTSGYDKYVSSLDFVNNNEGSYNFNHSEIFARTVLVNLNGGSAPPFNQDLPETGTIFRITSGKYIKAGEDEYEFSTTSIEKHLQNISTTNKFSLSQNFPNPFNSTTNYKKCFKRMERY